MGYTICRSERKKIWKKIAHSINTIICSTSNWDSTNKAQSIIINCSSWTNYRFGFSAYHSYSKCAMRYTICRSERNRISKKRKSTRQMALISLAPDTSMSNTSLGKVIACKQLRIQNIGMRILLWNFANWAMSHHRNCYLWFKFTPSDNITTNNAFGDADVLAISSDQSHPFNQRDFTVALFQLIYGAYLLETYQARIPCGQCYHLLQ